MANTIIIKNGAGAPPSDALAVAELGFDTQNKKLYIGTEDENLLINSDVVVDTELDPDSSNPVANSALKDVVTLDGTGTDAEANTINADTLDGKPASEYATKTWTNTQIEAALVQLHNQIITGAW